MVELLAQRLLFVGDEQGVDRDDDRDEQEDAAQLGRQQRRERVRGGEAVAGRSRDGVPDRPQDEADPDQQRGRDDRPPAVEQQPPAYPRDGPVFGWHLPPGRDRVPKDCGSRQGVTARGAG
ncbi:hypothetical protein ACFQL1_04370 [Halomicroarcula sp. GCM10025709]|uniref:hypothetical protein n=1 Tax=Halomicroarcula sp. GCM10025709 TaxID=3252669 RepID=UPI0036205BD7